MSMSSVEKLKSVSVLHNVLALGAVQALNLALPLVLMPFVTRALGVEVFGQLAYVQAIMLLISMLVDFGFTWSATRELSVHRFDERKVSEIFSRTWLIQLALLCVSLLVVYALIGIKGKISSAALAAGFLYVIGGVLCPVWLMQGMEWMKQYAFIQMLGKILVLPWLYWLVQTPEDLVLAVIFYFSLPVFVSGLISMVWLFWAGKIRLCSVPLETLKSVLCESVPLFFSRAAISAYTSLIPLALGAVSGANQLAFFSVADRIRNVFQAFIWVLVQAVFPRSSFLFANDFKSGLKLFRKTLAIVAFVMLAAGFFIYAYADWMVGLLAGGQYADAVPVLKVMAIIPLVVGISSVCSIVVLFPYKKYSQHTMAVGAGTLVACLLGYPLFHALGAEGAAWLILLAETAVGAIVIFRTLQTLDEKEISC